MSTSTRSDCGCGGHAGSGRGWRTLRPGYGELCARLGEAVQSSAGTGRQLLGDTVQAWRPLLCAWWRVVSEALPHPGGRCAVPETACPPACVCRLDLKGSRTEAAAGTVKVTNTDKQARTFHFEAETFHGPSGDTGMKPVVEPASAPLAPGQSVVVKVSVAPSNTFETGVAYHGRVLIRGAYEQCVCLALRVEPRSAPHCEVAQGAIPTHVRAHHWYDHFQCEELCFEPVVRGEVRPIEDEPSGGPAQG